MPTLQFKGKNIIWNHHLAVPFHTLDEVPELHYQPEKANGNMIIEGDNLLALKALLPQFAGKIKCIYIDPPYNTGNDNGQGKGWIYNDNVNSPLIKEWTGKEVGIDDLTRHDKWLCMTEATEAEPDKNICKDITRERVKRAIDKYGYDSGFKYYRLGIPLDAETMLAGQLPTYKQFAKYVYYLCTGEHLEAEDKINEEEYYVGNTANKPFIWFTSRITKPLPVLHST
jgi:DNA methylase.